MGEFSIFILQNSCCILIINDITARILSDFFLSVERKAGKMFSYMP